MRAAVFAARNAKELLRDPVSPLFGVGLPLALLVLMNLIRQRAGDAAVMFELERFTPGIAMFSLTFLSMFTAMLVAGDRENAFLTRLFASPMTAAQFLAGYCLPLLPLGMAQGALCFAAAMFLGLHPTGGVLYCLAAMIPAVLLATALGLLLGSVLRYRQVGPVVSLLVQAAALTSGMWFELDWIGGVFQKICLLLPFSHTLELMRGALEGSWAGMGGHLLWLAGYTAAAALAAGLLFCRQMNR